MAEIKDTVDQPVFIIGSGRCGTTLLRGILDHHPNIAVTPELKFFDQILARRRNYTGAERSLEAMKEITRSTIREFSGLLHDQITVDTAEVEQKLQDAENYAEIFGLLLRAYKTKDNTKVVIEKTPRNVFHLRQIHNMFPQARFIHMVRDGREFCASAHRRGWSESIYELCAWWREALCSFEHFLHKHSDKKEDIIRVWYEDLTSTPERELRGLLNFLDVNADNLDIRKALSDLPQASSFTDVAESGLYTSRHFESYFNAAEKEIITQLLSDRLADEGYAVDQQQTSVVVNIQYFFAWIKFRIRLWTQRTGLFALYQLITRPF